MWRLMNKPRIPQSNSASLMSTTSTGSQEKQTWKTQTRLCEENTADFFLFKREGFLFIAFVFLFCFIEV